MSKNDQSSVALQVSPEALNSDYCGSWLLKQYLPAVQKQIEAGSVAEHIVAGLKNLAQGSSFPDVKEKSTNILASLEAR